MSILLFYQQYSTYLIFCISGLDYNGNMAYIRLSCLKNKDPLILHAATTFFSGASVFINPMLCHHVGFGSCWLWALFNGVILKATGGRLKTFSNVYDCDWEWEDYQNQLDREIAVFVQSTNIKVDLWSTKVSALIDCCLCFLV